MDNLALVDNGSDMESKVKQVRLHDGKLDFWPGNRDCVLLHVCFATVSKPCNTKKIFRQVPTTVYRLFGYLQDRYSWFGVGSNRMLFGRHVVVI